MVWKALVAAVRTSTTPALMNVVRNAVLAVEKRILILRFAIVQALCHKRDGRFNPDMLGRVGSVPSADGTKGEPADAPPPFRPRRAGAVVKTAARVPLLLTSKRNKTWTQNMARVSTRSCRIAGKVNQFSYDVRMELQIYPKLPVATGQEPPKNRNRLVRLVVHRRRRCGGGERGLLFLALELPVGNELSPQPNCSANGNPVAFPFPERLRQACCPGLHSPRFRNSGNRCSVTRRASPLAENP
eukprot:gene23428-biopygen14872